MVTSFTSDDSAKFISLLPANAAVQTIVTQLIHDPANPATNAGSKTAPNDRLALINTIYTQAALKSQVRSYLSTALKVDMAVTESLLSGIRIGDMYSAYEILMSEDYINSTTFTSTAQTALESFNKAAILVNAARFGAADVDFLLKYIAAVGVPDIANLPVGNIWDATPASVPVDATRWIKLLEWIEVRKKMSPSPTGIFSVLQDVFDPLVSNIKQTWINSMATALQVNTADLVLLAGNASTTTPAGVLNLDFTNAGAYTSPSTYRRIMACLELRGELETDMNTAISIADTVRNAAAQNQADVVIQAVKTRYTNDEWLEQVKPVNDRLRTGRRDAMVAYLLAFPPNQYKNAWVTDNDLFETLLIDTEMMPIVKTSRIKQAISAMQLFIDRCALQKEKTPPPANATITITVENITQWNTWRKWYRIWEANRRIFVYPENWIEPDLRDDKSPFFVELEKFLKQNEITADTMADAYRTYLERLDEVSHLDIVGHFAEEIKNGNTLVDTVMHVWGRTKANPHIYFYRKRVSNVWTAWEKMETQVDGDQFAPVKWRGKLRLYWVATTEQTAPQITKINVNEEGEPSQKYLKIELCWTELKNGKWQPKQVGKEWQETVPYGPCRETDILYNTVAPSDGTGYVHPFTQTSFKDSFDSLKSSLLPFARINADGDMEIIVVGRRKDILQTDFNANSASVSTLRKAFSSARSNWNTFNTNDNQRAAANAAEAYYLAKTSWKTYILGRFTIKNNKVIADHNMIGGTLYEQLPNFYPLRPENGSYTYTDGLSGGYKHPVGAPTNASFVLLLKKAPAFGNAPVADKYVVYPRMIPKGANDYNVSFPSFFYKDYRNCFFVEKTTVGGINVAGNINFNTESTVLTSVATSSNTKLLSNFSLTAASGISTSSMTKFNISLPTSYSVAPAKPVMRLMATQTGTKTKMQFAYDSSAPVSVSLAGTDYYRFYPFYHYKVEDIMEQLDKGGIDAIFDPAFNNNLQNDSIAFKDTYNPDTSVMHYYPVTKTDADYDVYPYSKIDFSSDSPQAIYNWELFFHIPLLVANKLMQDQKFDEAMKWFHYVFNPNAQTSITPASDGPAKYWQFRPFHKEAMSAIPGIEDIMNGGADLVAAVNRWANDPFKPHLVARTRISAYMKNVIMKYLDNLVGWGDQLFRRDTMESINEATLLYVLAAQMLGKPPVKSPARIEVTARSYSELIANPSGMNAFSNAALTGVENALAPTGMNLQVTLPNPGNLPPLRYFCIPPNDKLLSYWDVVADRLFKIRNSQNIDGVERQLALFEPPIDPALLVKAAAAGVSLSDALNDAMAPLPQYRFSVMQQKAAEMVQEVKSLGGSLLSAIEKKDAEHLSLLRSSQEMDVMDRMREMKQYQLQEAQMQMAALEDQRDLVTQRRDYYDTLIQNKLNDYEQSQLNSIQLSIPLKINEGITHTAASLLFAIPDFKIGSPFTFGATTGGTQLGNLTNAAAAVNGIMSTVNDIRGSMAGIKGGQARREEEWKFQMKQADGELKQIEKQIIAAEIRASLATAEMNLQNQQFQNAIDLDAAMRDKYSNEELYDWMITAISMTYFQSYKLAFDLAKRAERCYRYELGADQSVTFIQFGYWDSLKKGLLAGEGLAYDLKRMDSSYLDLNKRQHELTKHISLAALDPKALLDLKSGSKAIFSLPEWLFDMDHPGHYFRRIKAVSISIPCVAGPYSTVSARLSLTGNSYRKSTSVTPQYADQSGNDPRFDYATGGGQSIATSSAQNDSGLFELNFRDERYLPFEGAGAVSSWTLELPSKYQSFDRTTISDVVIHLQYTAKYDSKLVNDANANLNTLMADATSDGAQLPRLFNLPQEFATEWNAYIDDVKSDAANAVLSLPLTSATFPLFAQSRNIEINTMIFKAFKIDESDTKDITITNVSDSSVWYLAKNNSSPEKSYSATNDGLAMAIDPQSVLKLKFSTTVAGDLVNELKNLDALWLAAFYTIS